METKRYELHFAPLQGYTDRIFRNAFARYFGGIDVYYTPFIRVERGIIRPRDIRGIDPLSNHVSCLIPQILPGSKEEFRLLASAVEGQGYTAADINLGCPFPLIAGKRKGAGMLPYPERVREVLATVSEFPGIRFSLKMRLGWADVCECENLYGIINDIRLCHVTVHARVGKQQYKGNTDMEAFGRFYEHCKHPLFYNGDLRTVKDIREIVLEFPALRGVSVGRGLLSSPFIGKEFADNETFPEKERMSLCFSFHEELFSTYSGLLQGENQMLTKMKTLWEYFLPEADRKLLKKIKKANKLSQYQEAANQILLG